MWVSLSFFHPFYFLDPHRFRTVTQEERQRLKTQAYQLALEKDSCIENLDAALGLIAEIADRFPKCTHDQQRAILLQMVERVIIDVEGKIIRIEWKSPFSYLTVLQHPGSGGIQSQKQGRKAKTSGKIAGSFPIYKS